MKKFNDNVVQTLTLVLTARLISEYQAIELSGDEEGDQNEQDSLEEEGNSTEEFGQEEEGQTRGGIVDPARTLVDPARTAVDPARTR
jgi:hypothetical protein